MIKCECIEKFRDKQNNIKGYRLRDTQGQCLDVKPDQLKMAIFSKQIDVVNLKLTTDGKLIDKGIDIITRLEQVDAYNMQTKTTKFKKYLKLVEHYHNTIKKLNEEMGFDTACDESFGINLYPICERAYRSYQLYSKEADIKLGENKVYYEVEFLIADEHDGIHVTIWNNGKNKNLDRISNFVILLTGLDIQSDDKLYLDRERFDAYYEFFYA